MTREITIGDYDYSINCGEKELAQIYNMIKDWSDLVKLDENIPYWKLQK